MRSNVMIKLMGLAALSTIAGLSIGAQAQPFTGMLNRPSLDRWMYPFNSQPGTEATAPIFAAIRQAGFDDRDGQCLLGFATSPIVPTGAGPLRYIVHSARISIVVSAGGQYLVNRRAVAFRDVPALAQELRSAGSGMKDPVVVINADNNATHQSVIRIMDAARQAGYGQIAFAVEQSAR